MNPPAPDETWNCERCGDDNPIAEPSCRGCGRGRQADRSDPERPAIAVGRPHALSADLHALGEARVLQALERPLATIRLDGVTDQVLQPPSISAQPQLDAEHERSASTESHNRGDRTDALTPINAPPPIARSHHASRDVPTVAARAIAPRRLHRGRRALPLAALGTIAMAALALTAARESGARQAEIDPVIVDGEIIEPNVISLEPVDATLGLTEDNKEVVMALCHRLSDHPSTECRRSYLTALGEYPERLSSFGPLMADAYEVSNGQFERCVEDHLCPRRAIDECNYYSPARGRELREPVPESMLAADLPAICVTYAEAEALCASRQMRLPTPDEWERIARSGDERLQPWGDFILPGLMNWGERILKDFPIPGRVDGEELTAPIDAYPGGATDEGVYNMLGNVAEWVDGAEDDQGERAGVRGGSYIDNFRAMRVTLHRSELRTARRSTIGFRCVADG